MAGLATFQDRLLALIGTTNTVFEFAQKHDINPSLLKSYLSGTKLPKLDMLIKLAEATGSDLGWLAVGKKSEYKKGSIGELLDRRPYYISTNVHRLGEYVQIDMVQGRVGDGGYLESDDEITMAVAFHKDWIERKGGPHNMSVMRIEGDSMYPTLQPGDIALINHGVTSVSSTGGIYAIAINNEIVLRRIAVSIPHGNLRMISDNKAYPDFVAQANQVSINGKVIWYARDLEH